MLSFVGSYSYGKDLAGDDVAPGALPAPSLKGQVNTLVKGQSLTGQLRIKRPGQGAFTLSAEQAKLDNTTKKPFTLNAEQSVLRADLLEEEHAAKLDKNAIKATAVNNRFCLDVKQNCQLLADYNLELIVDRSMSMRKPDCPGGLSRWEWCGAQAKDLANNHGPYVPNGLTIIPFATEYDVFEHASAQNIDYVFNNIGLQRGTRLFEPLAERLDNFFAHHKVNTKPLLLVVITDGMPFPKCEPELVKKELVAASHKMTSSEEVTIVFCQIGGRDPDGQDYLFDLDENLTSYGASYHYVHTIPFDELQNKGLGPTLVACLQAYGPKRILTSQKPPQKQARN